MMSVKNSNLDQSTKSILKKIYSHLPIQRKKSIYLILFLSVILSFTEAFSIASLVPFVSIFLNPDIFVADHRVKLFVNFFSIKNQDELFLIITISFVCLILLSGCVKLLSLYLSNKLTSYIEADFKSIIFEKNINQSLSYHLKQNSNAVLSSLLNKTNCISIFIFSFMKIFSALLIIIFIFIVLIIVNPVITMTVSTVLILFFLFISLINKNKILKRSEKISKNQDKLVTIFQDSIGHTSEIILYSLEKIFIKKFDTASINVANGMYKNQNIQETPRVYFEYIGLTIFALLIFFLNSFETSNANTLATIAALGLGAQKILPLINNIHSSISSIRANHIIVSDSIELLESSKVNLIDKNNFNKIDFKKDIKLKDLSFSYLPTNDLIIKNFDLQINKGDKIGIKGTTGSGKSTLGNIIIGLLDPSQGKIFIDDILITKNNKHEWQKNIALIPQNIFLNDATFLENIAIGQELKDIDYKKVEIAAKAAHIHDFIVSNQDKYNHFVGEKGARISGGQRQRIAIARAFYRNADLILFDEATNQLDTDTELLILDSIKKLDRKTTVIFITHRISTLDMCDQIVDLSKKVN